MLRDLGVLHRALQNGADDGALGPLERRVEVGVTATGPVRARPQAVALRLEPVRPGVQVEAAVQAMGKVGHGRYLRRREVVEKWRVGQDVVEARGDRRLLGRNHARKVLGHPHRDPGAWHRGKLRSRGRREQHQECEWDSLHLRLPSKTNAEPPGGSPARVRDQYPGAPTFWVRPYRSGVCWVELT